MSPTKTLLLLGVTSDIGRAIALRYGAAGWHLVLTARDPEAGERARADVATRTCATVALLRLDVAEPDGLVAFAAALPALPDTVVCAIGDLGEQSRAEADPAHAARILQANFAGPALLLGILAERMAHRGQGAIVGISSVAGERGRASNYVYGSAKAGLTAFLSGLRNRYAGAGLRVVTVKPGFVRTRMTRGMKLPPLLTAEPDEVAAAVFRAAEERPADVVYVRPIWRLVMAVIRAIPERLFKRLSL